MSVNIGTVAPVNVVKPTSNQPDSDSADQGLGDVNRSTPTKSLFVSPGAPSELIAAISKEIEPIHQFAESPGNVNKYGETIVFESTIDVVTTQSCRDGAPIKWCKLSDPSSAGVLTIIYHPEKGKVFMKVKRSEDFWPCATKELLEDTAFGVDGWVISFNVFTYCAYKSTKRDQGNGFLFEVATDLGVIFINATELIKFKTVVRNVQTKIAKKLLPTSDVPKEGYARLMIDFWYASKLRQVDVKVLFVKEGIIWKIKGGSPAVRKRGLFAFAQYREDKSLQMIVLSKNWRRNYKVPDSFTLMDSNISPDKNKFVWEWFIDIDERNACEFESFKEASDFRVMIDFYVDAWRKKSLSWDW